MFEHDYQSELSYLRDMGSTFARHHPAVAGLLAERGSDPDVERLLEGFAFVAARLRQRIDAAVPEWVEGMTELILPHFLRPTPASTIIEFAAAPGAARSGQELRAGTALSSRPVGGIRCQFRTSRSVTVAPIRLVSQRLDHSAASHVELCLRFRTDPSAAASVFRPEGLRIHLHGERATATQLYLWFARHVTGVSLRSTEGTMELGSHVVRPVGLEDSDSLFPWPAFSPHGVRLLLEYFSFAQKFLFFDVTQLDRALHLANETFELLFRFARPPALPTRLADDALRLHCVPAVNLFDVAADPVRTTPYARPTLLRASGHDPLHTEVFAVRSVVGVASSRAERRTYEPFHAFRHASKAAAHRGFYHLKREISPVDEGLDTLIRFADRSPGGPPLDEETLSIELTCTNRHAPSELGVGDVGIPTCDTPSGVVFSNISAVARPTRPPLGAALGLPFIAHLATSRRSLACRDVLKSLLALYNSEEGGERPTVRANGARIEAIRSVSAEIITRVIRRAAVRGTLFRVEVEQARFESEGDAFLFGSVLHRLLASHCDLHTFADLELVLAPTQIRFRWKAELPE